MCLLKQPKPVLLKPEPSGESCYNAGSGSTTKGLWSGVGPETLHFKQAPR